MMAGGDLVVVSRCPDCDIAVLRRALRRVPAALSGRAEGLAVAGNQSKVAPALADDDRMECGNALLAGPVADLITLAACFGRRGGASHPRAQGQARACQQDRKIDARA